MLPGEIPGAVASGFWLVYCRMKQRGKMTAGKDRQTDRVAKLVDVNVMVHDAD